MLSQLVMKPYGLFAGLAAFATPLFAAEPATKISAKAAAPIVRTANGVEYPPPAPLAPLPSTNSITPGYGAPTYSQAAPGISGYPSTLNGYYAAQGSGATAIYGTPGGYEPRIGSPYHYFDPSGGLYSTTGNPYDDHFGPGFHRQSLYGHYRFPYYNYRAPWYYPGRAVYNRDTNFAW